MSISRVSNASIFNQALATMMGKQSAVARTQLELSSGTRIASAQDDPLGAALSLAMERGLAEISRWDENSIQVQNRLQREETVLAQVGDRLHRLRELAVQANNGVHDAQTLRGLVYEMQQIREGMVQLANSTDGTGRYLFGGAADATPPFMETAAGVAYNGDQTLRRVEIGAELTVADTDPGSEVFMRIRTGNGVFAAAQAPGNSGSGRLESTAFTDTAAWDNGSYRIEFLAGDYTVYDASNTAIATGPFVENQAIEFSGIQVTLSGAPADGDRFTIGPAPNQDIFATIDQLIAAVQLPQSNPTEHATRQNQFYASIENLAQAGDWMIDRRASIGARLHTIDRVGEQHLADDENLRKTLSAVRDTDYAEAISRLSFQLQQLEAAQQSFAKVQDLSLFNFLR